MLCLAMPPPPWSTLFPYTTLFRSSCGGSDDGTNGELEGERVRVSAASHRCGVRPRRRHRRGRPPLRSEEHTSELQSRRDLVCRLLLEKKKLAEEGVPTVSALDGLD